MGGVGRWHPTFAVAGEAVDGLEERLGLERRLDFDHDAGLYLGIPPPRVRCPGWHHEPLVGTQGALLPLDASADAPGDDPKALLLEGMDVLGRAMGAGRDDDLENEPSPLRVAPRCPRGRRRGILKRRVALEAMMV